MKWLDFWVALCFPALALVITILWLELRRRRRRYSADDIRRMIAARHNAQCRMPPGERGPVGRQQFYAKPGGVRKIDAPGEDAPI